MVQILNRKLFLGIEINQDCMEILPTNSSLLNFVEFYRKEAVTSGRLLHVILIIFKYSLLTL